MINNLINELVSTWLIWMQNHIKSNDNSLSFRERREAGQKCESLQKKRQQIILDIDELFK